MIKEAIYKQKSRIQRLQLGDSNNKFFFAHMKGRKAQKHITMLTKEDGTVTIEPGAIVHKAIEFYKNLLGKSKHYMLAAQQIITGNGPVVTTQSRGP